MRGKPSSTPKGEKTPDTTALASALRSGDRRALARAITLVESTRSDHRRAAEALLSEMRLPAGDASLRLGITGAPGVGKSTFIEAFGLAALDRGHRLAILAIDPSSKRGGGSILGDKTRMAALANDPRCFIRPSPAGTAVGGVAWRTREAILLAEAAQFDVVIVETVGVGQSETAVAEMVDMFLLLLAPGAGDELQGIKRGIVELADLILVNKADGDLRPAAIRAVAEYRHALQLLRPAIAEWRTEVRPVSALERTGITEVWDLVERHRAMMTASGERARRRAEQARAALWREIGAGLIEIFRSDPAVAPELARLEAAVVAGSEIPLAAARHLLEAFARRPA
ncbi:MAG TPA: methylmalonyl Co-A mutase-associated GTPase MeaB [Stellaceae bacterium]|nr:methylmalonyl Co-A mutase-associated GTPase MeaB [Stellaceae bacterium]